ncbi:SigE family RNA polymerase sigma factor [Nocardioides caricicola]
MLRYGYVLTGDSSAAQDLVQSAFVEVYRRWRTIDPSGAEAYTRRVMTRQAWRAAKAHRPTTPLESIELASAPAPDVEGAHDVRLAVRRLSPDRRMDIVLRYWLGLTERQTASALGCSVGTVKSRTSRAMSDLRGLLDHPRDHADLPTSRHAEQ